jgi:hypothetical protein
MTSDPRIRDPLLDTADAKDLRPTQITVGYREVEAKRRAWRDRGDDLAPMSCRSGTSSG